MKKYTLLKKNVNNDRSKDSPAILMLFYYRWIRGGGGVCVKKSPAGQIFFSTDKSEKEKSLFSNILDKTISKTMADDTRSASLSKSN